MPMLLLDCLAEARIKTAIEDGELNDLPGAGRPLAPDDDRHVPEELRVAYRVLRNANCVPPEIETRREIRRVEELLALTHNEATRAGNFKKLNFLCTQLSLHRGRDGDLSLESAYYEQIFKRLGG